MAFVLKGFNFIAGFLLLSIDEENVFWLLSVICEDYFPGYVEEEF